MLSLGLNPFSIYLMNKGFKLPAFAQKMGSVEFGVA
jgi:hypothetical protein